MCKVNCCQSKTAHEEVVVEDAENPVGCSQNLDNLKKFFKHLVTFVFSRIGLCLVVISYIILGGLLFQYIESEYESIEKDNQKQFIRNVTRRTEILVEEIWNMTKSEFIFQEVNYTNLLTIKLNLHKEKYIEALLNGTVDIEVLLNNTTQEHEKWTVPGSILYAITLVTTIGYGHITCVTNLGKIVTILYSLVGLPMMGLCLANIGRSEANLCRFLYSQVCCGYCNYVKRRNRRLKITTHQLRLKSLHNSINKKNPETDKVFRTVSELESLNQTDFDKKTEMDESKIEKKNLKLDDVEYASDTNSVDLNEISVPISVVTTILISYIIAGGYIFKTLEDWTMLDGIYFCFITLMTIGFGDFVPGQSIKDNDTQSQLRSIGCAFYLLIGLSLVLMSINLLQEELVAKIKRLGVTLGFVNDPDYY